MPIDGQQQGGRGERATSSRLNRSSRSALSTRSLERRDAGDRDARSIAAAAARSGPATVPAARACARDQLERRAPASARTARRGLLNSTSLSPTSLTCVATPTIVSRPGRRVHARARPGMSSRRGRRDSRRETGARRDLVDDRHARRAVARRRAVNARPAISGIAERAEVVRGRRCAGSPAVLRRRAGRGRSGTTKKTSGPLLSGASWRSRHRGRPASARARSRSAAAYPRTCASLGIARSGQRARAARRASCGSKPRGICVRPMKLRTKMPAATTSTTVRPPARPAARAADARLAGVIALPSVRPGPASTLRSTRRAKSAGTRPKTSGGQAGQRKRRQRDARVDRDASPRIEEIGRQQRRQTRTRPDRSGAARARRPAARAAPLRPAAGGSARRVRRRARRAARTRARGAARAPAPAPPR